MLSLSDLLGDTHLLCQTGSEIRLSPPVRQSVHTGNDNSIVKSAISMSREHKSDRMLLTLQQILRVLFCVCAAVHTGIGP